MLRLVLTLFVTLPFAGCDMFDADIVIIGGFCDATESTFDATTEKTPRGQRPVRRCTKQDAASPAAGAIPVHR